MKSVLDLYKNINSTQSFSNLYILNPFIQSIQYMKTFSMNISRSECNSFSNGVVLQVNKQLSKDNNLGIKSSNDFIYYTQGQNVMFGKVNFNPTTQKHSAFLGREHLKHKVSTMIYLTENIYFGMYLKSNPQQKNVFYIMKLDTIDIRHKSTFIYSSEEQSDKFFYDELNNVINSYCKINKNTIAITSTTVKLLTFSDKYDGVSNICTLFKGEDQKEITNIIHWKTKSNQTKVTNSNVPGNLLSTTQQDSEQDYIDYIAFVIGYDKIHILSNTLTNKEFTISSEYIVIELTPIITSQVLTTPTGEDNSEIDNHYITCMTFINENGNRNNLAIGISNGKVRIFPSVLEKKTFTLEGHSKEVTCLVTLLSKQEFLSSGKDNKIILWEGQSGTILNIFWNYSSNIRNDTHYITSLCLFPSPTLGMFGFLALETNGTVSYWANQGDIESIQ